MSYNNAANEEEEDSLVLTDRERTNTSNLDESGVYEPLTSRHYIRAGLILMAEFCERLAYYSIDSNLLLVFLSLNLVPAQSNMLALFWKGTGYITPLLGGIIADAYLGRFKTILLFLVIYVLSMVLLAVGVLEQLINSQTWIVYTALFIIAVAMGGIKANVVTFGADQFQKSSPDTQQAFFNWFYFSVNCGSIISFTAVSYVVQNISLSIGLIIPVVVMFVAAIFIVVGYSLYIKIQPSGSVLGKCISLIYHCFKVGGKGTAAAGFLDRARYLRDHTGARKFEDSTIEDLKTLSRVFPIQATLIVFWCTYAQMSSVMFSQGTVMNLKVGDINIPVSFLNIFNSAAILILVPIFDRLLYPCLKNLNMNFNSLRRIGFGLIFASLAMLYAGVLEIYRKREYAEGKVITQEISGKSIEAVDMSIFWQSPAFILWCWRSPCQYYRFTICI